MKKYFWVTLTSICGLAFCRAQVPVSKEPRHHNIFENGTVRILDLHMPPGDTSQFHVHAIPSIFLVLTNVKTGSQVISEEDHRNSPIVHFGNIWFEGFYQKPRIHRVWNSDATEFHVMDIELMKKNYSLIDSPIQQKTFTFLFDEQPVRAYRLNMSSTRNIHVGKRKAAILMIQLSDQDVSVSVNGKYFHNKGDFLFIPPGLSISVDNPKMQNMEFAFFECR